MRSHLQIALTITSCCLAGLTAACSHEDSTVTATPDAHASVALGTWNEDSATAYLDQRAAWWVQWKGAARDHGTFCVSCHTTVPYILSQPAIHAGPGAPDISANERLILDDVTKRVRLWKDVEPYYSNSWYGAPNAVGSRGTESILNALILSVYSEQTGHLTDDTRAAFANLWALQLTSGAGKGAWPWQQFHLQPWEAADSGYYGAALAAIAVGTAPDNYQSTPAIQNNLKLLREYLLRDYTSEPLLNQTFLLLASAKLPQLLTPSQQKSIADQLFAVQRPDGGWSLSRLSGPWYGWNYISALAMLNLRRDRTPRETKSDGDATAMVTYAMQQSGIPRENPQLQRGLAWLVANQSQIDGSWPAYSLNRKRDLSTNIGRFMSDEATAYAVLALTQRGAQSSPPAVSQAGQAPPSP